MTTPPIPNRYEATKSPETEFEPGSRGRVLRNLMGIKSVREMDQTEFEALVRTQEHLFHTITEETRFTSELIRQIHREWLGKIYCWAGEYRTVNVSKRGFTWPPAYLIKQNMERFEAGLLKELTPYKTNDLRVVCLAIAKVHAEFLLIHPFRDGNGRVARILADLMSLQAGFPRPIYHFKGKGGKAESAKYLEGVRRGYRMDYAVLSDFFCVAITRGLKDPDSADSNLSPRAPSKKLDSKA